MYNHVVVVWNEVVFDYEAKYTYPLTEDSLRNVCGNNNSFTKITSGYGIFPSKEVRNSLANAHIEDWGGKEYYSNGTLKKYFLSKKSKKREVPYDYELGKLVPWDVVRVHVSSSILGIRDSAFIRCSRLEHVYIANGVRFIGENAFAYCELLRQVVMSDSVDTIECCAFSDCTSLKKIIIPPAVTEIDDMVFFHCRWYEIYWSKGIF